MSAVRARGRWKAAGAAAGVVVCACLATWAGASYVELARLQVDLADACARVEAVGRSRLDLVANLTQVPERFAEPAGARLAEVHRAWQRAERFRFVPELLADAERYSDFRDAQAELDAALDGFWPAAAHAEAAAPQRALEDLHARIERSAEALDGALGHLDGCVSAYREATARLPGSIVSAVARLDGPRWLGPSRAGVAPAG